MRRVRIGEARGRRLWITITLAIELFAFQNAFSTAAVRRIPAYR
jgi:hypothetical protein